MSIFGKLDAANIPTNPYYVEAGEYEAEVTKAEFKKNRDGERQLRIEYTINNEDSLYHDKKLVDFFNLPDADLTFEQLRMLPVDEQKKIQDSLSSLKRRLCGQGNRPGLGVDMDDLNDENWDPASLQGKKVNLGVRNWGADNQGVNISWVNLSE